MAKSFLQNVYIEEKIYCLRFLSMKKKQNSSTKDVFYVKKKASKIKEPKKIANCSLW